MIKLTIDFIKSEFEKEGYQLLTVEYKDNKQKLDYICPKGHESNISWDGFRRGQRCAECSGSKKKTIEFIRSKFEEGGYQLLTEEYENNTQKLEYICPEGHRGNICWNNFQHGQGCAECSSRKKTIEFIKSEFEKVGYILLTKEYNGIFQKLDYICPEGHKGNITWNNFKQGARCRRCYNESMIGENNPQWKGGIMCEPYCPSWLDEEFKESIKERDNYQCQNEDCWKVTDRLCIHHINYNKKDCRPDNLITLCNSCNVRANSNREYWQEYYENLIRRTK